MNGAGTRRIWIDKDPKSDSTSGDVTQRPLYVITEYSCHPHAAPGGWDDEQFINCRLASGFHPPIKIMKNISSQS